MHIFPKYYIFIIPTNKLGNEMEHQWGMKKIRCIFQLQIIPDSLFAPHTEMFEKIKPTFVSATNFRAEYMYVFQYYMNEFLFVNRAT